MKLEELKTLFEGKDLSKFEEKDWEATAKVINDKYINQVVASKDKVINDLKAEKEKAISALNSEKAQIENKSKTAEEQIAQLADEVKTMKAENQYLHNANYVKSINKDLNDYQIKAVLTLANDAVKSNPDVTMEDSIKNAINNLNYNNARETVTFGNPRSDTNLQDKKLQQEELDAAFSFGRNRKAK